MAPRRGKQKKKPHAIKSGHLLIARPGLSRVVHCNDSSENNYAGNYVRTTKYTLLSFLPKSLHEQFRRVANLYFLLIAILACTPLAPYSPLADTVPLVIVVGATMVKELVEDWRRKQQEKEVNNREVKLYYDGVFGVTEWKNLKVGDIVRVEKNEYFPADLILLSSSNVEAICYVETMNLDGETNLKLKQALDVTSNLHECSSFQDFDAVLRCEEPNANLYSFAGNLDIGEQQYPLTAQQLLLRDSKLRNTDCIHGVVVFTGHDTKVMQNSTAPPSKRSRIEKRMDILIYSLFLSLTAIALFGSIWFGIATRGDLEDGRARWYLRPNETTVFFNPNEAPVAAVFHFLTVLMLYSYLIPISLYVSLEIVKVIQTTFINQDLEMYYEHTDKPAVARTSNLNEELGQVDTILSDKTGTLTCNLMEFIKFSVAGNSYGHGVTEVEKRMARRRSSCSPQRVTEEEGPFEELNEEPVTIKGFNFVDERVTSGHWLNEPHADIIQKFLRLLAVCHTAVPDIHEATGRITYEAESPDEAAFVIAARELGFECYARTRTSVSLHELDPVSGTKIERHYKLLNIIEFSSSRKRMSVIVRNEEGQLLLLCKGADSVMFERLALNGREFEGQTKEHISGYADAGLRTLVLSYRELTEEEYNEFSREFSKAKNSASADREEMIEKVALRFEKDLVLLGATAVEDRLQYGVPECIEKLSEAGIKIWVLTGDKMETAVNIGFACSLLRHEMRQIIISSERPEKESLEKMEDEVTAHVASKETVHYQINKGKSLLTASIENSEAFALIIDGISLNYALEDDLKDEFIELAVGCSSVICCRSSPKQKALVTRLVRTRTGNTTLAIGDGANDVGMIQEADIGIGISGVEGMQAVMSSDIAIAQFRFLERLLLVHGHWCYRRISSMICYFFYKSIAYGFTLFFYEMFTSFSGQPAYNEFCLPLYNVLFTSFPVIALGVFEQDVSASCCLEFPLLHQEGVQNVLFSWLRIFGWALNGIFTAAFIVFFCVLAMNYQAFREGGEVVGSATLGITMYMCIVLVANCQMALSVYYFTSLHHILIWGGMLFLYIVLMAYGAVSPDISTTAYKVFLEACAPAPLYWLTLLFVVIAALLPYFTYSAIQIRFFPSYHQMIQRIPNAAGDRRKPSYMMLEMKGCWHPQQRSDAQSQQQLTKDTGIEEEENSEDKALTMTEMSEE